MYLPIVSLVQLTTKKKKSPPKRNLRKLSFKTKPKYTIYQYSNITPSSLPKKSKWFSIETITPLEKRHLPEFFDGSKSNRNEDAYLKYKSYMVKKWKTKPSEILTVGDCRRDLEGSLEDIFRVHKFLESWGLINRSVDNEPINEQTICEQKEEVSKIENSVIAFQDLTKRKKELTKNEIKKKIEEEKAKEQLKMNKNKNRNKNKNSPLKRSLNDLTSTKTISNWSPQEELYLLEGIELFGDNWDAVAYHVKTKEKDECVFKFVDMEMELNSKHYSQKLPTNYYSPKHLRDRRISLEFIPFLNQKNPILNLFVFLHNNITPNLSSIASSVALNSLMKNSNQENLTQRQFLSQKVSPKNIKQACVDLLAASTERVDMLVRKEKALSKYIVIEIIDLVISRINLINAEFLKISDSLARRLNKIDRIKKTYITEYELIQNKKNVQINQKQREIINEKK
ncbi:hypothetical protein M0813_05148 [Anaeramoeba flamelloides]|uniref:Uncharacterized protein n=1 Tax=Anaeramoeba flamelloides TaxID=1746091 RepID=A0ABQ8XHW7_9EUKA|nr:hypothetical protein M0813_05148 [Anaeramoeba flamelloides]